MKMSDRTASQSGFLDMRTQEINKHNAVRVVHSAMLGITKFCLDTQQWRRKSAHPFFKQPAAQCCVHVKNS